MSKRIPVPYRLGTNDFFEYEGEATGPVFMGDRVTIYCACGPDGGEYSVTGELFGVGYGVSGFIEDVIICDEKGDGHRCSFPFDGVFYKGEGGNP